MKLRKSIILIITGFFLVLVLILFVLTKSFTYRSLAEIEDNLIASNFRRGCNAINAINADLSYLVADWANWDDSFQFVKDRNQEFIKSNLIAETFTSQQSNLILILDTHKALVWGGYLPPGKEDLIEIPAGGILDLLDILLNDKRITKEGNGFNGVIRVDDTIFIVSSKNILTSNKTGPSGGWMIIGKQLGSELLEVLQKRTELNLTLSQADDREIASIEARLTGQAANDDFPYFIEKNKNIIRCTGLVKDILGKPVAALRVEQSRDLYLSGVSATTRLLAMIVVTGVVVGGLLILLIEKKVLSRLAFLNNQINAIDHSDLSQFTTLGGKDEIASLSNSISAMLIEINAGIDNLKRMKNSLAESEERFKSLFMNTGNPCIVVAEDTSILLANQEFYKIFTFPLESPVEGHSWTEFFHEEEVERMRRYHYARRKNEALAPRSYETRIINGNGQERCCILTAAMIPGTTNSSCSLLDITDQKKAEEELVRQAFYDSLTGLPNRQLFNDRLGHAILLAQRAKDKIGVLLFDIDEFKSVNDTLGHQTGDRILNEIATRMRKYVRKSDTMARLGGDEFSLMIISPPSLDSLCQIAEKIIEDFSTPYVTNNVEFHLGVSVGIAIYPDTGETPEDLLKNADLAMYESKLKGKNRYNLFTHALNDQAHKRQVVDRFIRHAIAASSFEVLFQPKVALADGRLDGMEALVRGIDAAGNHVSPGEFIPYAEANGLIVPIDMLVLRKACTQTALWVRERSSPLVVAVNISTKHFRRHGFVEEVGTILRETGLPPQCLELEITESALMKDIDQAINSLRQLREMGVAIALDDFGTGYSSLNYLHSLPITTMKIDKSFIDKICDSSSNTRELVRIVISLASSMNLQVVAEGVETVEQSRILREMNCALCQGYLFAKPLSVKDFSRVLAGGARPWRDTL